MISQLKKKGSVRFVCSLDESVKQVCLAGSFNNWQPVNMVKQKNGSYALELKMAKGRYEYKFVVDGVWLCDPDNADTVLSPLGTVNSVVSVG